LASLGILIMGTKVKVMNKHHVQVTFQSPEALSGLWHMLLNMNSYLHTNHDLLQKTTIKQTKVKGEHDVSTLLKLITRLIVHMIWKDACHICFIGGATI
jgi:hypothetical protein